jgi:ADP-ribose pyrophosphatase YjhB (NUDIX family)
MPHRIGVAVRSLDQYGAMFEAFPPSRREELAALAARYGTPLVRIAELSGGPFDPIRRADRRIGEVCFVVRRPDGTLLTGIKSFYPPTAYRLLTGGIDDGEPIHDALLRELREETGLTVIVRRFLAAIAYRRDGAHVFSTFAFLVDEAGGDLASADPHEQLAAFGAVDPSELARMATTLEQLPDGFDARLGGSWRDWGRFRAVVHRAVAEALADQ